MSHIEFVKTLVRLIEVANQADSHLADRSWQIGEDANSQRLWGDLQSALIRVAGSDFAQWLSSTGEINEDLIINRVATPKPGHEDVYLSFSDLLDGKETIVN